MLISIDPKTLGTLLGLADAYIKHASDGSKFRDECQEARDTLDLAVRNRFTAIERLVRDLETKDVDAAVITAMGATA